MADLVLQGGVSKETTPYDIGAGFTDSNLIRSRNGRASPIGGWFQRQTATTLSGVCRAIKEFSNNSGIDLVAFGTNTHLYILSGDTLQDITPVGFQPGPADASVSTGYGIGLYGSGAYSEPLTPSGDVFAQVVNQPLIWALDNFGQDLVACPYAEIGQAGPIYIWQSSGGFGQPAALLSANPSSDGGVPILSRGIFVSAQAECGVAVGCCPYGSTQPDPMQIRWSDFGNIFAWIPSSANNAGGYRLPAGSYIVGWLNTYYETIYWTDTTVYSQQLTGNSLDFAFNPIGQGMSMISPKASLTNGSLVLWMDQGCFFRYAGTIVELECPLKFFLFGDNETVGDINKTQTFKIHAAHNHTYSEAWWFYASKNSVEIDSYVMYNYRDNVWFNGRLGRTAWSDSGHLDTPIATDAGGNIYMQEYGTDAVTGLGTLTTTALPWTLTSGDMAIQQGDIFTLLERMIPDFNWNGTAGNTQQLQINVRVRDNSNMRPRTVKSYVFGPNGNNRGVMDMKVRGRRISVHIDNPGNPGTAWTMGKLQLQYFPNGKR